MSPNPNFELKLIVLDCQHLETPLWTFYEGLKMIKLDTNSEPTVAEIIWPQTRLGGGMQYCFPLLWAFADQWTYICETGDNSKNVGCDGCSSLIRGSTVVFVPILLWKSITRDMFVFKALYLEKRAKFSYWLSWIIAKGCARFRYGESKGSEMDIKKGQM